MYTAKLDLNNLEPNDSLRRNIAAVLASSAGVAINWRTSSALKTASYHRHRCLGIFAFGPFIRKSVIGAPSLQPTDRRQDKRREVRPGRLAEETMGIIVLPRCALLSHDVLREQVQVASNRDAA
jgi:hypothetical protein